LIAVANVVMNRLGESKRFGASLERVCLAKNQFSCWNQTDANVLLLSLPTRFKEPVWAVALNVAQKVSSGLWPDLTRGSNHYHATCIKPPKWAEGLKPIIQIGAHVFYKI
jgi:spore germination cell wall hydrolase CwlJ-like protein